MCLIFCRRLPPRPPARLLLVLSPTCLWVTGQMNTMRLSSHTSRVMLLDFLFAQCFILSIIEAAGGSFSDTSMPGKMMNVSGM